MGQLSAELCHAQEIAFGGVLALVLLVSTVALIWPWLSRFKQYRIALVFVLALSGGLVLSEEPLLAAPPPTGCDYWNQNHWPCWWINLFCDYCWEDQIPPM